MAVTEVITRTGSKFAHIFESQARKEFHSVVGISDIAQKDLTAFRTRYGLAANNITKTLTGWAAILCEPAMVCETSLTLPLCSVSKRTRSA